MITKKKNIQTMIGLDVVVEGSVNLNNGIIVYSQIKGSVNTEGPVRLAKNAIVKEILLEVTFVSQVQLKGIFLQLVK